MPTTYKTPGVYIEEISKFPPSVAAVETAIPAFLGYTQESGPGEPVRITSLLEYEQHFGTAPAMEFSVNVTQVESSQGVVLDTQVEFDGDAPSRLPNRLLYYSLRLFYLNGGGPCYIASLGTAGASFSEDDFTDAIDALKQLDEPTLLVFPDAVRGTPTQFNTIVDKALAHCRQLQDRFAVIDCRDARLLGEDPSNDTVIGDFRDVVPNDIEQTKYGAAYFPYLQTTLPFIMDDGSVTIASHTITDENGDPSTTVPIEDDSTLLAIKEDHNAIYQAVKDFLNTFLMVLPPSGAVAGVYARVDSERGVWKAPANVSISGVVGPYIRITDDLNDSLNVDPVAGKSINAIRAFTGKGTLVWGARTLAGNDNEWRYVSVRRFFIFIEESVKKASYRFVFEPNDANTWVKVRAMIENFLTLQWRAGGLAGAKPEEAFFVKVGLNETMTAQDILEGRMIVEIGLAAVRPAEFIILRFSHKMQES